MSAVVPPGWPRLLPPPSTAAFGSRVVGWLLDQCPPDYRSHEVLRLHPVVLAFLARRHVATCLDGVGSALAATRGELRGAVPQDAIEGALAALAAEQVRLRATLRELGLVEEALRGGEFRARL